MNRQTNRPGPSGARALRIVTASAIACVIAEAAGAAPADAASPPDTLDLHVMSQCPFGVAAEREIIGALRRLDGRPVLRLWFIARDSETIGESAEPISWRDALARAGDPLARFTSLHGAEEVREDAYQVAIAARWPDRLLDYLELRAGNVDDPSAFDETARKVGLDPDAVRREAISPAGVARLAANIARGRRLGIDASPTLVINGARHDGLIEELPVAQALCAGEEDGPCAGVPRPVPVQVTVVNDGDCSPCDPRALITRLRHLFPGLVVDELDARSPDGRSLMAALGLDQVPALVFDRAGAAAPGFDQLRPALLERGERYVLDSRLLDVTYYPYREDRPGRLDLLLAGRQSASARAYDALLDLLRRSGVPIVPSVHLVARQDPEHPWVRVRNAGVGSRNDGEPSPELRPRFVSARGADEVSETLRQACLLEEFPGIYPRYQSAVADSVRRTGEMPAPWSVLVELAGIDHTLDLARLDACARGPEGARLLLESISLSSALKVSTTPSFLVGNRLRLTGLNLTTLRALVDALELDVEVPAIPG